MSGIPCPTASAAKPATKLDVMPAAVTDPGPALAALENLGERDTRRLYTNRLVDQVLLLREFGGAHLVVGGRPDCMGCGAT